MLELAGVTEMEYTAVELTVTVVVPWEVEVEKLLGMVEVTVIVVLPAAMAVTRPVLLIVATDGYDELQVTCEVMSWLVWSLKEAVAVSCRAAPTYKTGLAGNIIMPLSFLDPAHVGKDPAKDPRSNIARTNRIFLISPSGRFSVAIYTHWQGLSTAA